MVPTSLATLLAFALAAHAAPTDPNNAGSFTVPSIRDKTHVRNGAAALARAYRKYGTEMPTQNPLTHSNIGEVGPQTGVVPAVPEAYHSEYLSPVTIGNQAFQMNFDTGSSDFWVWSTYLTPSEIGNHSAYNPNASPTFQPLPGYRWSISYGDGSGAAGVVGRDKVTIGGATVTSQAIEMATAVSSSFQSDENSDGLVGLGFNSINNVIPVKQQTFLDNARSSLQQPLFAADLREDGSGRYFFGTTPPDSFKGPIQRVNVNNTRGYWQFASRQVMVGDQVISRPGASPAIADTGTSLLIADDDVVAAWYGSIPGAGYSSQWGGFVFPCDGDIPSLGLTIGGPLAGNRTVTIPPSLLSYVTLSQGYCYGSLQSNNGLGLQIYGDILFRAAFVVFYREGLPYGPQLGIADKA